MKYAIEISEEEYAGIVKSNYPNDQLVGSLIYAVKNGEPLDAVLGEIRAEINSLSNANPSYWHSGDMVEREEALDIIDKYRAESEGKECI